jgi:hypothetical protein
MRVNLRSRLVEAIEATGVVVVVILFAWLTLGGTQYPGWPPSLLPGHNLVSKTSYACPIDYNDQGIIGPAPDYEIIYLGTCSEEHYGDGTIVFRMGLGTSTPGQVISQGRDLKDMSRFPVPPEP